MCGCRRTNLRCKDKTWRQIHKASNVLRGFPCSPLTQPLGCFLEATINYVGELPRAARIWTVLILCNLGLQEKYQWWKVGTLFEPADGHEGTQAFLWACLAAKVTCSRPGSSGRSLWCVASQVLQHSCALLQYQLDIYARFSLDPLCLYK